MDTPKKASSPEEIATRLAEAAKRANAEAEVRRAAAKPLNLPPERGGPKGLEPTRYGDWEKKGLISDF
ncbi:MAG: succinate dehydrogenase assembly factor 4 [Pseudomonadota bacterium]